MNRETVSGILFRTKQTIVHHAKAIYHIVDQTMRTYNRSAALEATAGLAYYSMFSLFPLALLLVVAGSSWFKEELARQQAIEFVTDLFPISQGLTTQLFQSMLERRGAVTIVSIVGLLWAASGFFNLLVRNINRAWPGIRTRHFVRTRLEALIIVVAFGVLFLLSILATSVFELLGSFNLPFWQELFYQGPLRKILSFSLPLLVRMGVLWGLYYWIPKTKVDRWAAFWSALVITISWWVVNTGFTWYLNTGLTYYDLVYGSLSTTIVSMFWLYLSNYTLLLGAYLCVAISDYNGEKTKPSPSAALND